MNDWKTMNSMMLLRWSFAEPTSPYYYLKFMELSILDKHLPLRTIYVTIGLL